MNICRSIKDLVKLMPSVREALSIPSPPPKRLLGKTKDCLGLSLLRTDSIYFIVCNSSLIMYKLSFEIVLLC